MVTLDTTHERKRVADMKQPSRHSETTDQPMEPARLSWSIACLLLGTVTFAEAVDARSPAPDGRGAALESSSPPSEGSDPPTQDAAAPAKSTDAAAEMPDSPAGAALGEWLRVLREGDTEAARQHYDTRFAGSFRSSVPAEQYMGLLGQLRTLLSGAELTQFDESSELGLTAHVRMQSGGWLQIQIEVEPDDSHAISGLLVRPGEAPEVARKEYKEWQSLAELVEQVREDSGLPAMAAVWIHEGKIVDRAVVGVREMETEDRAQLGDRFHIGSVTKSITATLIGRLVEKGKLAWDRPLAQALPDFEMRSEYRGVTIEQILQHRAGIPPALHFDDAEMQQLVGLPGTETEQRAAFLREILRQPPVAPPGTATHYSNAGYALAGFLAERAGGKPWNELVKSEVFDPLGLATAGFGWPATSERPGQPRGHYKLGNTFHPQGLDDYPLGAFLDPANDVHCSIEDLARYAAAHLAALHGSDGILEPATVQRLHTPPEDADYAGGWMVTTTDDGEELHWHNGTAGTFYALVALFPESDEAIVVAINAGGTEPAALKVVEAVRQR